MSQQRPLSIRHILGLAATHAALLATATIPSILASVKPSVAAPEPAQSADQFVESIGVAIHLHYFDTIYSNFEGLVQPALRALGVRHVRDGAYSPYNVDPRYYERCRALATDGIRFNLIANRKINSAGRLELTTPPEELDDIYEACDGAVVSFEAWNEPDLSGVSTWAEDSRNAQQLLHTGLKSNPLIAHLPLLAPSLAKSTTSPTQLGNLEAVSDRGNMHIYFGGFHPETNGWGGSFYCNNQYSYYGSVSYNLNCVSYTVNPSNPGMATEVGFNNMVTPSHRSGVPESIAAKYMTRTLLNNFNQGIQRSYLYELLDEKPDPALQNSEQHWGLVRNDGTAKPAFSAVQNLISLLKDPGAATFTPSSLDYTLTGDTANVHRTLLQKQNGEFYLAVWLGLPSWDPNQPCQYIDSSQVANDCVEARQLSVAPQAVSLTVPSDYTVTLHHWQSATGGVASNPISEQGGTVNFQVTDELAIFQLTPNQPTETPPTKCRGKGRKQCVKDNINAMFPDFEPDFKSKS